MGFFGKENCEDRLRKMPRSCCKIFFCFRLSRHIAWSQRALKCCACVLSEQCVSAYFVDFHRQCKQTTISQNLLIRIWGNFPEFILLSHFNQWKLKNKSWTKEFCHIISIHLTAIFINTSKTVCYGQINFKKWGWLIVRLCKFIRKSNDWILRKPTEFKILSSMFPWQRYKS